MGKEKRIIKVGDQDLDLNHPRTKHITKEALLLALSRSNSIRGAARYLHVSYPHVKKYAKIYTDPDTGVPLMDLWKNQSGKGIAKYLINRPDPLDRIPLQDIIEGRGPVWNYTPQKIKNRLIKERLIQEKCCRCGFSERRITDNKIPLILYHKNGNKEDFHLENLAFYCYNCSFLYADSPLSEKQALAQEEYVAITEGAFDWELSEEQKEALQELGLWEMGEKEDTDYVSKEYRQRSEKESIV